jgi:RNA polymerase sigma-70 factor (ECF subfamily)
VNTRPDEFIPTRASLLSRLKDWEDEESWREFFTIYRRLIFSFAIKAGLNDQEAEEIVQETIISVAKTIKGFDYDPERCKFKSWLGHLTRKRIADRFRKRSREIQGSDLPAADTASGTKAIERVADPNGVNLDAIWEDEWQKKILDAAVERTKHQVNPEQFQMFDFYVLRKMPVRDVAKTLGVNVAQVYLAKHRVAKLIKKEVVALEEKVG